MQKKFYGHARKRKNRSGMMKVNKQLMARCLRCLVKELSDSSEKHGTGKTTTESRRKVLKMAKPGRNCLIKFFCVLAHALSHQQLSSTQRAEKISLTEKLKITSPFRGVMTREETRIRVRKTLRLISPTLVSGRVLNIADSPPHHSCLEGR